MSASEKIRKEYEACKERGDLAYFWQFQNAIIAEIVYVIAQNPELFFSKITEEQWQAFVMKTDKKNKAMFELAKYDDEMAVVLEMFNRTRISSSYEENQNGIIIEDLKQYWIANKDGFIAKRNALLQ